MSADQKAWTEVSPFRNPDVPKEPITPDIVSFGVLMTTPGNEDCPQWLVKNGTCEEAERFADDKNQFAKEQQRLYPAEVAARGMRTYWAVQMTMVVEVI